MTDPLAACVCEEWGRLTALLLARFRRLDLVEDALGDAVERAARSWGDAPPDNPSAWLLATARRRILDQLRHEEVVRRKQPLLAIEARASYEMDPLGTEVDDDLLRLVLMCAHPALEPEAASALSLRLVLGVATADIARLFLVGEPTVAARITRAKKRIVGAGVPFRVPDAAALPPRIDTVAQTAYLAFTAGYAPGSGPDLLRADLSGEAIRLVRVALGLRPEEPALVALLALQLLQHARRDARARHGRLVLLADQDRDRWHRDEIAEAQALLESDAVRRPMSALAASYLLQARIAAEHARALTADDTRWGRIVELYDALLRLTASPSARLARAVAVAEARGPAEGLAALAAIEPMGNHRLDTVRAELLARDGQTDAARAAYDQAIALCRNEVETAHLRRRRADLDTRI